MGLFDIFKPTSDDAAARSALDQAADPGAAQDVITRLIEKILSVGIDGIGPFDPASDVAAEALADAGGNVDKAIAKVVSGHVTMGAVGGFVTGVGGFVTLPIALPVNVFEFYAVATRMTAAIATLRGYDPSHPEIRSAVLLTLVGSNADGVLTRSGITTVGGRTTMLALKRLPRAALMVVNKAIGFRLLRTVGGMTVSRLGRAVPFVGGGVGAGFDGWMMNRIAEQAVAEFPVRSANDGL